MGQLFYCIPLEKQMYFSALMPLLIAVHHSIFHFASWVLIFGFEHGSGQGPQGVCGAHHLDE
jgi:hypothetical protein